MIAGTFDVDNESYFDKDDSLFPTVVAARIYTYGNISTLNRLYNYEMGIDYAPFDVEETEGKDFENYEGYQDKIGRYLYIYGDGSGKGQGKSVFKSTPDAPTFKVEKTLVLLPTRKKLEIPFSKSGLAAEIRNNCKVYSEEYTENGIVMEAELSPSLMQEAYIYINE